MCIVRGADAAEARQRIVDAFDSGDAELLSHFTSLAEKHLEVLAGDLAERSTRTRRRHVATACRDRRPDRASGCAGQSRAALLAALRPERRRHGGTDPACTQRETQAIVNVSTVAVAIRQRRRADRRGCGRARRDPDALRARDAGYADGYATSKWAGEVLLRDANERFGMPVCNFRSDMILAHSRYRGQLNVPDMFTRWMFSIVVTGLAPRSFYRAPRGPRTLRRPAGRFHGGFMVALGEHATQGLPHLPRRQSARRRHLHG